MAHSKTRQDPAADAARQQSGNGKHPGKNGTAASPRDQEASFEEVAAAEEAGAVEESDGFDVPDQVVEAEPTQAASPPADIDPAETEEWLESLRYVLETKGAERVNYLLAKLDEA